MAGPIRISVLANASQAKSELASVSTTSQRVGAGFRKMALPAIAALGAIGAAAFKATQAAADDEAAQVRLAQSLKTAAGATREQIAATETWIGAQGKALGVTDDELRPAIAKLATATGSVSKAQKLASLAMNISAGSGKSLEQVTTALAKAQATGSVTALAKYGVATKNAAGETKGLAQVTEELAGKYRGAASAAAGTAAGQQKKLQVQLGELQEEIGAKLLPVLSKMAAYGLKAVEWMGANQGKVTALIGAIAALAATVLLVNAGMKVYAAGQAIAAVATAAFTVVQKGAAAASLGTRAGLAALAVQTAVTSAVTKTAAAAQWVLNAAMSANPIGLVVIAIIALVAGLVLAYKKSETFRKIVDAAFKAVGKTVAVVVDFIKAVWSKLFEILKTPIQLAIKVIGTYFKIVGTIVETYFKVIKTVWSVLKDVLAGPFQFLRDVTSTVFGALKAGVRAAKSVVVGAFNGMKATIQAVIDFVQRLIDKIQSIPGIPGSGAAGGIKGGPIVVTPRLAPGASTDTASRVTSRQATPISTPTEATQTDRDTKTMVGLLIKQNSLLADLIRIGSDAPIQLGREINSAAGASRRRA